MHAKQRQIKSVSLQLVRDWSSFADGGAGGWAMERGSSLTHSLLGPRGEEILLDDEYRDASALDASDRQSLREAILKSPLRRPRDSNFIH